IEEKISQEAMALALASPPPAPREGGFGGRDRGGRNGGGRGRGPRRDWHPTEMTERIKVAVAGHRGRVGSVLVAAFQFEPNIEFVGGIGRGDDLAAFLHERRPQALVDFTRPSEAVHNALAGVAAGASPVIGTTGLSASDIDKLETACQAKRLGGIVAPNFAVGAVLMMHLADIAAPHFD